MKINTQTYEVYGGDRNVELAVERGEPLADLTEEQAVALEGLDAKERSVVYHEMLEPVAADSPPRKRRPRKR